METVTFFVIGFQNSLNNINYHLATLPRLPHRNKVKMKTVLFHIINQVSLKDTNNIVFSVIVNVF